MNTDEPSTDCGRSTWRRGRCRCRTKQARRFGDHALDEDRRRGHVFDKVYSLTGVHHGDVEVASLAGCRVSRRLYLDLSQQVDLAPEPVIGVGVPQRTSGERRWPRQATRDVEDAAPYCVVSTRPENPFLRCRVM